MLLETGLGPLLPEHWSELIIGIILFLLVFLALRKLVVPQFEAMYAERVRNIQGGMEEAHRAQDEANAAKARYESLLADAHGEAARIREDAKNQGAQIIADMRGQAQTEADRITSNAHVQVQAERQQAYSSLQREVGGLATGLASKIVGESLGDDDRSQRTIDRFLAELEAKGSSHGAQAMSSAQDAPITGGAHRAQAGQHA